MAGLKSSVSHLVTPSGPPPKLIFDQLEPRMLMSADPVVIDLSALHPVQPTNDVVVRLLNQVVTTGNQTTNIERVEAVDANNPANVLSSQVVPTGSNVTVIAAGRLPGGDNAAGGIADQSALQRQPDLAEGREIRGLSELLPERGLQQLHAVAILRR